MPKISQKHIDALSRGQTSGIRIGSRGIPHHLYTHERAEYIRACSRRYLTVDIRTRQNLQNLWYSVCSIHGWRELVLYRDSDTSRIYDGADIVCTGTLEYMKVCIVELVDIRKQISGISI
jgi:hypothetical protein